MVTLNLTLNTPEELKLTADYLKGLAELSPVITPMQEPVVEKPKKQTASKHKSEKVDETIQTEVEEEAEGKPAVEEKADEPLTKEELDEFPF